MSARRLMPETKTLRYMINAKGMVACKASTRVKRLSFDLFGFVDVVGIAPRRLAGHERQGAGATPWLLVQATSSDNQGKRRRKILETEVLRDRAFVMVNEGHDVEVWGWIRGRHAKAEAFHRFSLRGSTPAGMVWHDHGIVEVDAALLVQP